MLKVLSDIDELHISYSLLAHTLENLLQVSWMKLLYRTQGIPLACSRMQPPA